MGAHASRLRLAHVIYRLESRQFEVIEVIRYLRDKESLGQGDITKLIKQLEHIRNGIQEDSRAGWEAFDNRTRKSIERRPVL